VLAMTLSGGLFGALGLPLETRIPGRVLVYAAFAVVALIVDLVFAALQRAVTPRGLRKDIDFSAVQTAAGSKQPQEIPA